MNVLWLPFQTSIDRVFTVFRKSFYTKDSVVTICSYTQYTICVGYFRLDISNFCFRTEQFGKCFTDYGRYTRLAGKSTVNLAHLDLGIRQAVRPYLTRTGTL